MQPASLVRLEYPDILVFTRAGDQIAYPVAVPRGCFNRGHIRGWCFVIECLLAAVCGEKAYNAD